MPARLLVSVRSADEALAALDGGADVIDIKDPSRGPLGMASPEVITEICNAVAGRRPVTAALGELSDWQDAHELDGRLAYVKMALAAAPADWRARLAAVRAQVHPIPFIAAAYADCARSAAPSVNAILSWLIATPNNHHHPHHTNSRVATRPWSNSNSNSNSTTNSASALNSTSHHHRNPAAGLLIDTAIKDGQGLLHWLSENQLRDIIARARSANLLVALAGSLHGENLQAAVDLAPDLVAVRGAACAGRDRQQAVDASRVAALKLSIEARNALAAVGEG